MTNQLMPAYKESCLDGTAPDLVSVDLRFIAVDSADYTFSQTHIALDDIPGAARVATSGLLTGKAVTNGQLTADNNTFPTATGDEFEYLFLYYDSGVESTSVLITYWDGSTGLPYTPDGTDITINCSSGIFSL